MEEQSHEEKKPKFAKKGKLLKLKRQMYSRFKQPVTHPRRELSEITPHAQTDWKYDALPENRESAPVKQKQKQKKARRYSLPVLLLMVSIIIFLISGVAAALFFITGSNTITSRKIDVVVHGPRTLEGGDEMALQVSVHNNNSVSLENADLIVTYPSGAREPSNTSSVLTTKRYPLGSIEPNGVRNGIVRGVYFGNNGETKEVQLEVEYRIKHSSGTFVTQKTPYDFTLSSSALDMSFTTNTEAVSGQPFDITVTITSSAKKTIKDVVVQPSYPFGFVPIKITPDIQKDGMWELGDLSQGDSRVITIDGTMKGQSGDKRVFRFLAGTRNTSASGKVDVILADVEHLITVKRPFLGMSLTYDGKSVSDYIAHTGKAVPITLSWRNNLDVALDDVVIVATIKGTGFDEYNISVPKGFYRSVNSSVIWDKTTTGGVFAHIAAGASGTLSFNMTPKTEQQLSRIEKPTIELELFAQGRRLSEKSVPETLEAITHNQIRVATDVSLEASGLYTENPLGSVGPLPPKVNNKTVYGILWEIYNSTNSIQNTVVTAELPPYVQWEGVTSPEGEKIVYNNNDRTITWYVGTVLSHTGVGNTPPRRVLFTIGFVPSTTQVGNVPNLIQSQVLTGTDSFTNVGLKDVIGPVTSGLHEAHFSDYYGIVTR